MMRKYLFMLAAAATGATTARAAITVSGLNTESTYDNAVTFTVQNETGYTTVSRLDGEAIDASAGYTARVPGYHELRISKTPAGGGAEETAYYQFIVQDAANRNGGGADNGLPTWVPVPNVDAPQSVLNAAMASFVVPKRIPAGVDVPVAVRLTGLDGQIAKLNATALTQEPGGKSMMHRIYRGAGTGQFPAFTGGGQKTLSLGFTGGIKTMRQIESVEVPVWTTLSGTVSAPQTVPAGAFIHINGDLTVAAAASLTIEAGAVVKIDTGVDIEVEGKMTVNGTMEDPVYFYPAAAGQRWGGIWVHGTAADLDMTGAMLTGACEDSNWLDEDPHDFGGHHVDQPVITFSGLAAATTVSLTDSYIFDILPGQALHGDDSNITLTRCVIQRCTTGGQIDGGRVQVVESHIIEAARDNGVFEDDDNDGLYMTGGTNEILRSVISNCKDDGLDAGSGPGGSITIDGCWIESCWHESMAWSCDSNPARTVTVINTVSMNSGQGVEAGFGGSSTGPRITAANSLFLENAVGARFGDNYDWDYPGQLTVRNSTLIHNLRDVWGIEWNSWTYRTDRMTIEDNRLSVPNEKHPDNTIFDPATDGGVIAPLITLPDMVRGFGIAGAAPQQPRSNYGGTATVRLDRPATGPVKLPWRVIARSAYQGGREETAATGIVEFSAGQSVQRLALPPLTNEEHGMWPWIVLKVEGEAGKAEATGVGALHFMTFQPASSSGLPLVTKGSSWRYYDGGDIGAAAWTAAGFGETGWKTGAAELGYGDGDEATSLTAGGVSRKNTYYFRRSFNVGNLAQFSAVTINLRRDDGAVVYLNGKEVWRTNMPGTGTVTYETFAISGQSNADEDAYWPRTWALAANPDLLVEGENLIAVEVHQISSSTSDISFDLEMTGQPTADVSWQTATLEGAMYLLWKGEQIPQWSGGLTDWIDRPEATSPWRIGADQPRAFFRLRQP